MNGRGRTAAAKAGFSGTARGLSHSCHQTFTYKNIFLVCERFATAALSKRQPIAR